LIEVCGLCKSYGARPAIQDVSFQVARGEILGFLGPNGAGKSTTMRILAGCLAPTTGTARIAGYDIFEQSLEARRSLGYLPEQVPLYPEMGVEEYLLFAASLRMPDLRGLSGRLEEVLARCGLVEVRGKLIGRLSRGYRQRVGLAQAILPNPPVLILDEPTVGLDPRQIIEVRELIRDLAGDHTVLLSTHILPEVSMLCTRVVIIDHGRVVAEDHPESLTGAMHGGERLILEVEGPAAAIAERLRAVPGVASVQEAGGQGVGELFSPRKRERSENAKPAGEDGPVPSPLPFAASPRPGAHRPTPTAGVGAPPSAPPPSRFRGEISEPLNACRFLLQLEPGDEAFGRGVRRQVADTVVAGGDGLLELRAERLTLEDVFVRLTTTEAS
jgi:ABC-2 type transport system ATP-binding protein